MRVQRSGAAAPHPARRDTRRTARLLGAGAFKWGPGARAWSGSLRAEQALLSAARGLSLPASGALSFAASRLGCIISRDATSVEYYNVAVPNSCS
jgi:hypothetical protein